jgi:hypothetical protein
MIERENRKLWKPLYVPSRNLMVNPVQDDAMKIPRPISLGSTEYDIWQCLVPYSNSSDSCALFAASIALIRSAPGSSPGGRSPREWIRANVVGEV